MVAEKRVIAERHHTTMLRAMCPVIAGIGFREGGHQRLHARPSAGSP